MFLAGDGSSTTDFPVVDCRLLPTITEITVIFRPDLLRCLGPGSGASRTEMPVLGPRRKRGSTSTNNNVVVAAAGAIGGSNGPS